MNKTYLYLPLEKSAKKSLAWLLKAVSKDDARPTLTLIKSKDEEAASADGFRIHTVTPNPIKDTKGLVDAKKLGAEYFEQGYAGEDGKVVRSESTYPDYNLIFPKREPVFRFGVNPKFLIDILSGLEEDVTISLYSPTMPILVEGRIGDEYKCKALVMPIDIKNPIPTHEQEEKALKKRQEKIQKAKITKSAG